MMRMHTKWVKAYEPMCQSYIKELQSKSVEVSELEQLCPGISEPGSPQEFRKLATTLLDAVNELKK